MRSFIKRLWPFGLTFLGGVAVAAVIIYFFARPVIELFALAPYERAASTGQLYVMTLNNIHDGATDKARERLGFLLDAQLMMLADYEEVASPGHREPGIYKAVAAMRTYRQQYPSLNTDPAVLQQIQKGLDLGKTTDAVAQKNGP